MREAFEDVSACVGFTSRINSLLVVQEVVRHVIARVSKNTPAVHSRGSIPVVSDDGMCEFPERCCKHDKQRRWHD